MCYLKIHFNVLSFLAVLHICICTCLSMYQNDTMPLDGIYDEMQLSKIF